MTIVISIDDLQKLQKTIKESQEQLSEINNKLYEAYKFIGLFGFNPTVSTLLREEVTVQGIKEKGNSNKEEGEPSAERVEKEIDVNSLSKPQLTKELEKYKIKVSDIKRADKAKGAPLISDLRNALKEAVKKSKKEEKKKEKNVVNTELKPAEFEPFFDKGYALYKDKYIAPLSVKPFEIMGILDANGNITELSKDDIKKLSKLNIAHRKIKLSELNKLIIPTTQETVGEPVKEVVVETKGEPIAYYQEKSYEDKPIEGEETRESVEDLTEEIGENFNKVKPNISDITEEDYRKAITASGGQKLIGTIPAESLATKSGLTLSKIYNILVHSSQLEKKFGLIVNTVVQTPPTQQQRIKLGTKKRT